MPIKSPTPYLMATCVLLYTYPNNNVWKCSKAIQSLGKQLLIDKCKAQQVGYFNNCSKFEN